jgi:hypothetical protein
MRFAPQALEGNKHAHCVLDAGSLRSHLNGPSVPILQREAEAQRQQRASGRARTDLRLLSHPLGPERPPEPIFLLLGVLGSSGRNVMGLVSLLGEACRDSEP